MPAGALVTVPAPLPFTAIERFDCGLGAGPKFATTFWSLFIDTIQPPVPEHAPPQPVKTKPAAGLTVIATFVPDTNEPEHVLPQLMPAGLLESFPPVAGEACTVSVCGAAAVLDVGVLVGLPPELLPESVRAGVVAPPPHPESTRMKIAMITAHNPASRPPNWFTNSSCPSTRVLVES